MRLPILALIIALAGCSIMYVESQPHLQSVSAGQPTCFISCQQTQTATKGEGGNVTGATVTQSEESTRSITK